MLVADASMVSGSWSSRGPFGPDPANVSVIVVAEADDAAVTSPAAARASATPAAPRRLPSRLYDWGKCRFFKVMSPHRSWLGRLECPGAGVRPQVVLMFRIACAAFGPKYPARLTPTLLMACSQDPPEMRLPTARSTYRRSPICPIGSHTVKFGSAVVPLSGTAGLKVKCAVFTPLGIASAY